MIAGRTHPDVAHREGERYRLMLERRVLELGLERPRRVRRPLPLDRRALRPARRDRRLRDAVPQPRADRVRRAHVRDRRRLRRRLDAVLVRAGHARVGRRARSCRSTTRRRSPTPSATTSSSPDAARGGARRGAADRFVARVAVGRRGDGRRCCGRRTSSRRGAGPPASPTCISRACAPTTCSRSSTTSASCSTRTGSSRTASSGYCVDDVARLAVVSLALARRGDEQIWTSILYRALAFLHAADRTRAGCATSWATTAAGSTSRTSATTSAARSGRSARSSRPRGSPPSSTRRATCSTRLVATLAGEVSLRTAAYAVLGLSRLDADRLDPRARAAARAARRAARRRLRGERRRGLALVRGRAHLRQRAPLAGADQRRQRARPRRPRSSSGSSRCAGSATSRGLDGRRPAAGGPPRAAPGRAGAGRRRRAAARRRRARRGRARRVRRHARAPSTACVRSRAFEWFLGRNRLQRPLYDFATGGCSDGLGSEALNENEGAESTLAFHRAALAPRRRRRPRRSRADARSRPRRERSARALRAPSRQPDPDRRGLAVSRQRRVQPGRRRSSTARPSCSPASRTAEGSRTSPSPAPRTASTAGRSTPSRCSRPTPASRASSGASRTRASSGSTSSSAG